MRMETSQSSECSASSEEKQLFTRVNNRTGEASLSFTSITQDKNNSVIPNDIEKKEEEEKGEINLDTEKTSKERTNTPNENSDVKECWFCRDVSSTEENPLITNVCKCRGSIGWIHRECIDEWVFSQRRTNCPSCYATYNIISSSTEEFPNTLSGELFILVWKLFLPLTAKTILLLFGFTINNIIIPSIIGMIFYHKELFSYINNESSIKIEDNSTNSNEMTDNELLSQSNLKKSSIGGFWLFFSIILFGWICVTLWRFVKMGWRQWVAVFSNEEVVGETKVEPYTMVECAHWILDSCLKWAGCSRKMIIPRILELLGLMPLAFILSFPFGRMIIPIIFLLSIILWRIRFTRKRINDVKRRFMEVQERKGDATKLDICLWFGTYVCETALFSVLMPISAGIVVHFAISPYLLNFPETLEIFIGELSLLRLISYWMLGTTCSMTLMQVELTVIVPLFAPGVDLFFIRSVDLNLDGEPVYWSFILAQVFDADPLRVFCDYIRMSVIELITLYVFLSTPLYIAFTIHHKIMSEKFIKKDNMVLPIPSGFPSPALESIVNESNMLFFTLTVEDQQLLFSNHSFIAPLLSILLGFKTFFRHIFGILFWILRYPTCVRWAANILIVIGVGTVIACMKSFPITHMQLKALRPLSVWMARNIVNLEGFLFDAGRLTILDRWLCGDGLGDIPMPEQPIAMVFVRRERNLPPDYIPPKYLRLRLVIYSLLFFITSSLLFWAGPLVCLTLILSIIPYSVPAVCAALNLFFLILNPRMYLAALAEFLLLSIVIIIWIFVQPVLMCAPLLNISRRQLVQETMEFYHHVRRTVGAYDGEPHGSEEEEWEDVSSSELEFQEEENNEFELL